MPMAARKRQTTVGGRVSPSFMSTTEREKRLDPSFADASIHRREVLALVYRVSFASVDRQ
jgi:hypothetical protein